ncbi:thiamine pyrophosphate-binding protein [Amycolatopsis rhabdoformis]|uniref:Thiamine pyrophosphate-binding protein n=1 Tax=Amycolatopsis rhabdoformis TaxID=1448059 RepID=A0ABZ1IIK1_9PSEU|nr:thiamine pyrophosphate-binding protein [Amycolatopsis rhabdoformis]WSE33548.1 thiamine pyrophosphate-binding protein [Amycolatopsis rhabdoformis]
MSEPYGGRFGSDLIVDLLVDAGIEHVAFNPGASFRGIHDSLVHRPDAPAISLCLHESIAVSMAQGYAKASGKPMAALLHNVVGLQNASMSIYNAWCDRVPMLLLGGTGPKATPNRRPWIDWIHTASVQAGIVRDFVKWDDEPHDLGSVEESFARALAATTSVPEGPVYLCYDVDLQENPVPDGFERAGIGRYAIPTAPAPSTADVAWLVDKLRGAERPVLLAGYVGERDDAFAALVELAEALGAAVVDTGVRHAFPTTHPLAATHVPEILAAADVVLALDVEDIHSHLRTRYADAGLTILNVSTANLKLRAWAHDYQAMVPAQRFITAGADAVVSAVLDRLRHTPLPAEVVAERVARTAATTAAARATWQAHARSSTADGAVPLERMLAELGSSLSGVDFVLGGATNGRHEHKFLSLDRPRQYTGWAAGGGLGYGLGGALGTALAQEPGTITVDVQADGDLLFLPSALWTAAHQSLPVLILVNNNRQYGNTVEHAAKIGARRGHDPASRYVGAGLTDPAVDFSGLARSYGVWSSGPIADPETLQERLAEAVKVVSSGKPALLDVLTPGF